MRIHNNKTNLSIYITVVFVLFAIGCTQDKGVMYKQIEVWNPDSTAYFDYRVYSLGPPSGYKTIGINGEEILRYDEMVVIYGGWSDNKTFKILSSDLPIKNNTANSDFKIIVEQANGYDDYKRN